MARILLKINNITEYYLAEFDATAFIDNPMLKICSDDLRDIKDTFSDVELIEIFQGDNKVCETTLYDKYSSIQYLGSIYSASEGMFVDCMQVNLQKTSLVEQVDKIEKKIFPVYDFDAMTVEEYRQWLLADISSKCSQDVYAGTSVQISTGIKHFSYNQHDQMNIQSIVALLLQVPELPSMPYHADGELCYLMSRYDLIITYLTLHMRLLALTTRCNHLNMWIRTINTKEELMEITYDTPLPQEYQAQVDAIMASAVDMVEELKKKYLPTIPDEDEGDEEENEE